jgi:hypothetical protein
MFMLMILYIKKFLPPIAPLYDFLAQENAVAPAALSVTKLDEL